MYFLTTKRVKLINYRFMHYRLLLSMLLLAATGAFFSLPAQPSSRDSSKVSQEQLIDGKAAYIEGLKEFENENYERALDLLSTAYVKLPEHSGVNFALADAYLQIDDLPNASFYGKKAVELEPGNKWYHLKLAEIYRRAGKNEATIEELERALEYHPDATDVLFELAQTYAAYGEFLKSNKTYNKLLDKTGDTINLHLQKLKNFNELGMRDSSIAELQTIRQLDPDNISTMQMLSNYYLEMNKPEEAKAILKEALEKNKRDPKTLIMLADIYVGEARWDRVGTLLGDVISDPVINPEAKLTVAQYLISQFQQESSNRQLRQATSELVEKFVSSEPDFGPAYALAADFYTKVRENDEALQALAKTNELMPSNDEAWRQRMQLLLAEGKYEEAIEVGAKAEKNAPQDPFIMFFWGSAYLAEGQNRPAAEKLEEAASLPARKELKSAIYNSLGDAYAGFDEWEKAFSTYEKALEINPANDLVLNNYAYFLSLQKKNLEKAKKMALKAIQIKPQNASYLDTVGWVFYQLGEYEKARKYIQASIDTGQASAEVLEHLGDVMDKLGKPKEARKWWQKAFQKDSTRTYLKEKITR